MINNCRPALLLFVLQMLVVAATGQSAIPARVTSCPRTLQISATAVQPKSSSERATYSLKVRISVSNLSDKDIVLAMARVHVSPVELRPQAGAEMDFRPITIPEHSHTHIEDYFFSQHVLGAGSNAEWEASMPPYPELQRLPDTSLSIPEVEIAVEFVQFADGSIWGNKKAGDVPIRERNLTFEKLNILVELYEARGETEFLNTLMQEPAPTLLFLLQDRYRKTKDASVILTEIRGAINNANDHRRHMGPAT